MLQAWVRLHRDLIDLPCSISMGGWFETGDWSFADQSSLPSFLLIRSNRCSISSQT
jgi:hypothetical protein